MPKKTRQDRPRHYKLGRLRLNRYEAQKGYWPKTVGVMFYDWDVQPTLDVSIGMRIYSVCWVRRSK